VAHHAARAPGSARSAVRCCIILYTIQRVTLNVARHLCASPYDVARHAARAPGAEPARSVRCGKESIEKESTKRKLLDRKVSNRVARVKQGG
jgi:hypothetical protein